MADETVITEETETEEKGTGTDQTKTGKTFSQEDVNKFLAKEKAAWKRGTDKDKGELDAQITTRDEKIQRQNDIIQKQVDLLRPELGLPEMVADKLFADKDAEEQLTIILDLMGEDGRKLIPKTPKGEKKESKFKTSFTPSV